MTLPLELGGIQNPDIRRAFEQVSVQFPLRGASMANDVLLLAVPGTARKVAFGSVSLTFSAAVSSNAPAITHGLDAAPVVALGGSNDVGGNGVFAITRSYTSTQFTIQGISALGAISGTIPFVWVAIG